MNVRTETDVIILAHKLMMEHHIEQNGWDFGLNKRLHRALGVTKEYQKRIELKYDFALRATDEEVEQAILHEIAHAMAGVRAGHGREFREWGRVIGVKEDWLKPSVSGVTEHEDKNWVATCPGCLKLFYRKTAPNMRVRRSCSDCSGPKFNEEFILRFVRLI